MINRNIAILLVCAVQFFTTAATGSPLTEEELLQLRFDQKIGSQIRPALAFKDETGKSVSIGDYFDQKPSVLILGYYGCPMLCTLVLNGSAECLRNLTWKAGQQFNVVFVSINPMELPALAENKKKNLLGAYGAGVAGWHFLTGDQNSITNLAAEVGFQYAYDPEAKQYAHPSGIVILTPAGKVARYFFGVNFSAKDVDAALRDASINQSGSRESQFTLLCFHDSPARGKYGKLILDVVRISGMLVLVILAYLLLMSPRAAKAEKIQ